MSRAAPNGQVAPNFGYWYRVLGSGSAIENLVQTSIDAKLDDQGRKVAA